MATADPKTQEPLLAWAVVCPAGGEPTLKLRRAAAEEWARREDKEYPECGPHRVVELREVRDGGE